MFQDLGGRITGSLALSFIPTEYQGASSPDEDRAKGVLNACAVLHTGPATSGSLRDRRGIYQPENPPASASPSPGHPNGDSGGDDGVAAQQVGSAGKS